MIKRGLVVTTSCLFFLSSQSFAAQKPTISELQNEIETINHRTVELQQEVNTLKAQLRATKKSQHKVRYTKKRKSTAKTSKHHKYRHHSEHIVPHQYAGESHLYDIGATVTTSPYLGIRTNYTGDDLVVNYPTMNEDLRIMRQREMLAKKLDGKLPSARRPYVELSGDVEGQGVYLKPYRGSSTSDIDLTSMEFDILADASPWAFALVSMQYDNSLLDTTLRSSGYRVANSNVFVRRAFVTVGNLRKFPIYGSLGQMYVPFGKYAYYTLSTPVTEALGQTNERAAVLGFAKYGFYAQVYGFKGDAFAGNDRNINQWGLNAGYAYKHKGKEYELGAGYIANLADSGGMQVTPGGAFQGFGDKKRTERLVRRVPALNIHGEADFGAFDIYGEYIAALRSFDRTNLMFNNHGAIPKALNLEAGYNFKLMHKPVSVAFSYGRTWESLALGLPQQNFTGVFNISFWKNTIESIEFRHGINYAKGDTSGGNCVASPTGFCQSTSDGGSRNSVIGQLALFF